MDINDWRAASTVLVAIAFFAVCWWAFSPKRKKKFDEAANLPFADEKDHESKPKKDKTGKASDDASGRKEQK